MIKVKISRDQLKGLCVMTNPAIYEKAVAKAISEKNFNDLDALFNIIQIGEMLSKKWLYTCKASYKIGLNHSEAASLFKHLTLMEWEFDCIIRRS